MERIADSINRAHEETAGVTVVLENVAGMVCSHPSIVIYPFRSRPLNGEASSCVVDVIL